MSGQHPVIDLILAPTLTEDEKVARLRKVDRFGLALAEFYPVHHAVRQNLPKVVNQLLVMGCRSTVQEPDTKRTPLHYAAMEGHTQLAKILIGEHKRQYPWFSWAIEDSSGRNPLHYAAMCDNSELVALLLTEHAKQYPGDCLLNPIFVNKQDNDGCSALHYAAIHNQAGAAEVLLLAPDCNITLRDGKHRSPLMRAAHNQSKAFIHCFMNQLEKLSHSARIQSHCEIADLLHTAAMQSPDQLKDLLALGFSACGAPMPRRNYPPLLNLIIAVLNQAKYGALTSNETSDGQHDLDLIKRSVSLLMAAGAKINEPCLAIRVTAHTCEQMFSPSARELVLAAKTTEATEASELLELMESYWGRKAIEYYAGRLFWLKYKKQGLLLQNVPDEMLARIAADAACAHAGKMGYRLAATHISKHGINIALCFFEHALKQLSVEQQPAITVPAEAEVEQQPAITALTEGAAPSSAMPDMQQQLSVVQAPAITPLAAVRAIQRPAVRREQPELHVDLFGCRFM